ncbi:MAG TPA: ATP-binding protein [Thermoanaerobaculia bacterium]|nr:ATP-binding protein [Thermoanaerobaculia bacterium]
MARRLEPDELRAVCEPATLAFRSTAELPPLDRVIGQDRAVTATTFGIGMKQAGYNLFVLGPAATGKTTTSRRMLLATAAEEPTPPDYCYVHNFADAYRPTALALPAGRGRELRQEMERLVEEVKQRLPQAFESEEFERHKSRVLEDLHRRQHAEMERLDAAARAEGFAVLRTHGGLALAFAPQGEPLAPEAFAALPEATRESIEARGRALEERVEATLRQLRQVEREARAAHEKLVEEVAASVTRRLVQELRERFAGLEPVQRYLDQVEADLIAHAEEFRGLEDGKPALPFLPPAGVFLERYRVNVFVDRSGAVGAPVVLEENPTHGNLLGRIEHRVHFGTLVTDFTLVKAGALHRANGGYLILEAKDVLRAFQAWEALKKALKSRSIRIEEPLEEYRLISAVGLAPEPIPLSVKVVLLGTPFLYYVLYALDEDFRELFKVKVDFDDSLPRSLEFESLFARFVAAVCQEEALPPFSAAAVARLIEQASRMVSHQQRLTSRLGELRDHIREAAFWAARRGQAAVDGEDVSHAIAEKTYRANLVEERLGRTISEGTLLIATDGEAVGQLNGISVLALGDHAFGRPARITARTFAGQPGVVDIEREAKLGGPIHSKGVMILTGFLAGRYAREQALALSASIAFEQQYEEVEGDSASAAELYALLSSLAGIPLGQSLAVTGSVNQRGEIQPVGGINEKIEGFFDACRRQGLTGRQGVLIPEANVRHLMLREDVVQAVREARFHVHAVATVDEGLELLTGRPAGAPAPDGHFPEGSVNAAVEEALAANVRRLKELRAD